MVSNPTEIRENSFSILNFHPISAGFDFTLVWSLVCSCGGGGGGGVGGKELLPVILRVRCYTNVSGPGRSDKGSKQSRRGS